MGKHGGTITGGDNAQSNVGSPDEENRCRIRAVCLGIERMRASPFDRARLLKAGRKQGAIFGRSFGMPHSGAATIAIRQHQSVSDPSRDGMPELYHLHGIARLSRRSRRRFHSAGGLAHAMPLVRAADQRPNCCTAQISLIFPVYFSRLERKRASSIKPCGVFRSIRS